MGDVVKLIIALVVVLASAACGDLYQVTAPSTATIKPALHNCQTAGSTVSILDECGGLD